MISEEAVSRLLLGVICGLAFGIVDVGIMLPMGFFDKRAAMTAAFIALWNQVRHRCSLPGR